MKIAHTVPGVKISSGGLSRNTVSLCESMAKLGADVGLICPDDSSPNDPPLTPDPVFVKTVFTKVSVSSELLRFSYSLGFRSTLKRRCRDEKIAVINDHGIWLPSNHSSASVARDLGIPLVIHPRGMLETWALSYRRYKKKAAWILYQKKDLDSAAAFVAASEKEADAIRRAGLRQPVAIIPNGINLPDIQPLERDVKPFKTALYLSRIHPSKGLLNLVEAWKRVKPSDWIINIVGPDELGHTKEVKKAVESYGLSECFNFYDLVEGRVKDRLFREADLFILPTFSENFGVVVAEALSYCVPVITTTGSPWKSLEENKCGWWVEPCVEALEESIRQATRLSDSQRHEMGIRGRRLVENRYIWSEIATRTLSVYDWLVNNGPKPSFIQN